MANPIRSGTSTSEIGTSSDTEEEELSALENSLSDLVLEEKSVQQAAARVFLLKRQDSYLSTWDIVAMTRDLSEIPEQLSSNGIREGKQEKIDPLDYFVSRFDKSSPRIEDPTRELAIRGRNVLHYMAEKPWDDERYEPVIRKICEQKWCSRLIEQKTDDNWETPFHVICLNHNYLMLRCLVSSLSNDAKDCLRLSGLKGSRSGRNVFLCFGHSLLDKKISQVHSVAMFSLLVELYERKVLCTQLRASKDSQDCSFLDFVRNSSQMELMESVVTVLAKK